MSPADGSSYAQSGVSFEKADSFLEAMLGWIRRTEEFPGAGLRPLIPNGYYASVLDLGLEKALAIATDGVGSKILVAEAAGDYSSVGIDCIDPRINWFRCRSCGQSWSLNIKPGGDYPPSGGDVPTMAAIAT